MIAARALHDLHKSRQFMALFCVDSPSRFRIARRGDIVAVIKHTQLHTGCNQIAQISRTILNHGGIIEYGFEVKNNHVVMSLDWKTIQLIVRQRLQIFKPLKEDVCLLLFHVKVP